MNKRNKDNVVDFDSVKFIIISVIFPHFYDNIRLVGNAQSFEPSLTAFFPLWQSTPALQWAVAAKNAFKLERSFSCHLADDLSSSAMQTASVISLG